jgi:hypothetical protein
MKEGLKMVLGEKKGMKPNWSTGKLPEFTGLIEDWMTWKENALSRFALCGLSQVLDDKQYAVLNADQNAATHAMIRQCVASQKKHIFLSATVSHENDGHSAWQTLVNFYENEKTLDILLRLETDKLKALQVTEGEDFQDFAYKFTHTADRLKMLYKLMADKEISPSVLEPSNYNKEFLAKIHLKHMSPRIETIKQAKPAYTLHKTFLELLAYDMEHNLTVTKASASVIDVDEDAKPAPKVKTDSKANGGKNHHQKPNFNPKQFYDALKKMSAPDEEKNALLSAMRPAGGNPHQDQKRKSFKNKAQKAKKRRTEASAATLQDFESWSKDFTK